MKKVYLIALLAALGAAFVSYLFAQSVRKSTKYSDDDVIAVYVAIADVEDGVTIDSDNFGAYFELKPVQKKGANLTPNHVTEESKADVIGRVTTRRIFTGEQLSTNAFSSKTDAQLDLSYTLYPGEVAYSIEVPDTVGVGGFIRVGDTVDIIGSFEIDREEDNEGKLKDLPDTEYNRVIVGPQKILYSRFVGMQFEDLEVIAIGTSQEHEDNKKEELGELKTYTVITVRMKREDADDLYRLEQFVEGQENKNYKIVLNSREDSSKAIDKNRAESIVIDEEDK